MTEFRPLPYYAELNTGDTCLVVDQNSVNGDCIIIPKYIAEAAEGAQRRPFDNYHEWFTDKAERFSVRRYLGKCASFGEVVFSVSPDDIVSIVHPLDKKLDDEPDVQAVVDALIAFGGVDRDNIGLEGSRLLSTARLSSDIDLITYGYEAGRLVQANFALLGQAGRVRLQTKKDAENMYSTRQDIGFGQNRQSFVSQQLRRFYGFIDETRFGIINSIPDNNHIPDLHRRILTQDNYVTGLKARVVDDIFSPFTPSLYTVQDIGSGDMLDVEAWNHYATNQARTGEIVELSGQVYRDKESGAYRMVQSFWSKVEDQFNLKEQHEKSDRD